MAGLVIVFVAAIGVSAPCGPILNAFRAFDLAQAASEEEVGECELDRSHDEKQC